MTPAEATYWEYCEKCRDDTPHRFLSRQGLEWIYQCKRCGTKKITGPRHQGRLRW